MFCTFINVAVAQRMFRHESVHVELLVLSRERSCLPVVVQQTGVVLGANRWPIGLVTEPDLGLNRAKMRQSDSRP